VKNRFGSVLLIAAFSISPLFAQLSRQNPDRGTDEPAQPVPAGASSDSAETNRRIEQPKRILGIIPNYRAVSADEKIPPLTSSGKFTLATKDSFDYSSFVYTGILAGIAQANKSVPEFGHGPAGYGRYYWHSLADVINGNYMTEFVFPAVTREDPRYYTRGHGTFVHRTGYALSRIVVTRTDSGHERFNISEILGNGAGAALSNLYYPESQRTWIKTRQKWTVQIAMDGVSNVVKEFWPNISAALSRKH
jgi:hypothetical protein